MLTGKVISIVSNTVVDEKIIAKHGAVINTDTGDISFFNNQADKESCKNNREIVRADQAEFEDFAYSVQEKILGK